MDFFKKNIKIIITSVILIIGIIALGVYNLKCVKAIESKRSSYTRTEFDFKIENPSIEQLDEIKNSDTVESVYPYHLCTNIFTESNKPVAFVSTPDYKGNERIGFLGDGTLIKGSFDGEGAVLDEKASEVLGAGVGDTVSFKWGSKQFEQKVKAVCLSYSYHIKEYENGIALLDYTSEMKAALDILGEGERAYTGAFVKAKGSVSACGSLLRSVLVENIADDNTKTIENKLDRYDVYAKSKTDRLEKQVNSINIGVAFAIAIFYSALNVLFIVINRNGDKTERDGGVEKQKMFKSYFVGASVCAAAVTVITFAVLLIFGITTHFIAEALGTVLALSLPALVAIPVAGITAKLYTDRLYANRSKEADIPSLRG